MSVATLPTVCAWCERVRTSAGRWEDVDEPRQGEAVTTHGICPECLAEQTRAASEAELR